MEDIIGRKTHQKAFKDIQGGVFLLAVQMGGGRISLRYVRGTIDRT